MNPIDHPHGGGEGKTSGGRNPVTPWGVPTKGYRTRKPKASDKRMGKRRYKYWLDHVKKAHLLTYLWKKRLPKQKKQTIESQ